MPHLRPARTDQLQCELQHRVPPGHRILHALPDHEMRLRAVSVEESGNYRIVVGDERYVTRMPELGSLRVRMMPPLVPSYAAFGSSPMSVPMPRKCISAGISPPDEPLRPLKSR